MPDDRNSRDINKDFGLMGFRIPAIAVSPYVRRGHVAHSIYGFESILKMIEYRFGLEPLTTRDALRAATSRARSTGAPSRGSSCPNLPRPEHVVVAGRARATPTAAAQRGPTTTT